MKESSGKTKKLSKGVRRARSMRNVVMMVLVCVLMLSAATYAWFTLSNTAKVANMTMTVGEVTGLQIAPDYNAGGTTGSVGTYGSVLAFDQEYVDAADSSKKVTYNITGDLLPATMITTSVMRKPVYAEDGTGEVISTSTLDQQDWMGNDGIAENTYYAYKTTFYLKALGEEEYVIKLADRSAITKPGVYQNGITGTYILNDKTSDTDTFIGADAIRICLETNNDKIIYAANNVSTDQKGTVAPTATNYLGGTLETVTNSQGTDGKFTSNGTITLQGNEDTRVTMTIWIEGTDPDCANEMSLDNIIAQLQFVKVESPTT